MYISVWHMVHEQLSAASLTGSAPTCSFAWASVDPVATRTAQVHAAPDDQLRHLPGQYCRQQLVSTRQHACHSILHRALDGQHPTHRFGLLDLTCLTRTVCLLSDNTYLATHTSCLWPDITCMTNTHHFYCLISRV